MQTLTARVLIATMFADALTGQSLTEVLDDLNLLKEGVFRRTIMPPPVNRLPTRANRRYHRARVRLRRITGQLIDEHRTTGTDHGDLLSILLASRVSGSGCGQGLSDAEITDQLMIFFFAGIETTAAVLAWALHLLSLHPHIEQRLHAEVDTVLAGAAATFDDVPRLPLRRPSHHRNPASVSAWLAAHPNRDR
jgi:cytochrome P450